MAHPGFGHLWQRPVLSDVDVVLCVENAATPNQESAPLGASDKLDAAYTVLQQFPAHGSILTLSPVFEAQMLRWQTDDTAADSSSSSKRQIRLTLPDDSYEPAALAVLAILYLVKPVREQLAELTSDQQVQAAVLADMWQVLAAVSAAVELLTVAANSAEGLPDAAFNQLLGMPAVPACLLPVLHQALLSKFGDMQAVWADAALQKALLKLPLFAVELLLCSDKLKGVTWRMGVRCDATKKGTTVFVFVCADDLPAGTVFHSRHTLEFVGFASPRSGTACFTSPSEESCCWGWADLFGVGTMTGGFDAAVWAAKGLPAEGQLVFRLTVERVV